MTEMDEKLTSTCVFVKLKKKNLCFYYVFGSLLLLIFLKTIILNIENYNNHYISFFKIKKYRYISLIFLKILKI